MPIYYSSSPESVLHSIEFAPTPNGNLAFITLRNAADREAALHLLHSGELHQKLLSESKVNGQPVLVTQGQLTESGLIDALAQHGTPLAIPPKKKEINWWSVRGGMGLVGQFLQLGSSFVQMEKATPGHPTLTPGTKQYNPAAKEGMWVRKGFTPDIGVFAIFNIVANFANIFYGGQQEKDKHQLRYVKTMINDELTPHLEQGQEAIDIKDDRSALRSKRHVVPTTMDNVSHFFKNNSVRIFELGLRSLAAAALVFPFSKKNWGESANLIRHGQIGKAVTTSLNTNKMVRFAGFGYLTGKAIAWFSQVPDPYNPTPPSLIDTIREKYLFSAGSVVELAAGSTIAVNAFRNKRISTKDVLPADQMPARDYLGTGGGGLFAGAYGIRLMANFGSKKVDMDEVIAHTSDMLAKTPPEKRAQLLADSTALLAKHFAPIGVSYGSLYARLYNDLQAHHPIPLHSASNPSQPVANVPLLEVADGKDLQAASYAPEQVADAKESAPQMHADSHVHALHAHQHDKAISSHAEKHAHAAHSHAEKLRAETDHQEVAMAR